MFLKEDLNEIENLEDKNLEVSFKIVEQLIRYSIQLSFNLKDNNQNQEILNLSELNFIQFVKSRFIDFKREDVLKVATDYGIKQRKLDKILSDKRYFIKMKYGHYRVN
jgi:phage antirepressor YoqD-like protein